MSTKPSFVRCPYCRHKLEKVPKRKTNCPDCGKPIYVRGGDLLREDELDQAAAKPKKPAKKKPAAKKESTSKPAAKKKPRKKKPAAQGQLAADLKRKKKEKYGPDDLLAGLQLLLKVAGTLLASGGLGKLLGSFFGGGTPGEATRSADGLAGLVQSVDSDELLQTASEAYTSLNEEEQFQMRAVVAWIQNGFQLPEADTA
ncbi:MAG TPA: hypothetical protein P5333_19925 [Caldilinea sp.]|nr:hypothetical protein [Caldilinea sp.]